jgi:hypothetical protein
LTPHGTWKSLSQNPQPTPKEMDILPGTGKANLIEQGSLMDQVSPALKRPFSPIAALEVVPFPDEMEESREKDLTVVMPVFNDWGAFKRLVKKIDSVGLPDPWKISILAVDDGSPSDINPRDGGWRDLARVDKVEVLHLHRNLGHQRAIAVALAYTAQTFSPDAVMVMDSDGEDRPEDMVELIRKGEEFPGRIIFARRGKRSEGLAFRFFYRLYRMLYRILTGSSISFGNFCLIPAVLLRRLVFVSEIWNHFAAGVARSKLPLLTISVPRGRRIEGRSTMNLNSLVVHGLSAIAVHMESVAVRLLLTTLSLILLSAAGMGVVAGIRLFTDLAIPGWATNVSIGLLIILLQSLLISLFLVFLILTARSQRLFVPQTDSAVYVSRREKVFPFP